MSIIDTGDLFPFRYPQAGKYGIEIDRTDGIHFPEKKVKEQPYIIFCIESLAFIEPAPDPFLLKIFLFQGEGRSQFSAHKNDIISICCQTATDTMHPLIECEIVGNSKEDLLAHAVGLGQRNGIVDSLNSFYGL